MFSIIIVLVEAQGQNASKCERLTFQAKKRYVKCGRGQSTALYTGRPAPFVTCCMVGREDKRTNDRTMFPALKNNVVAGYQGPVKIELLKGAGLLEYTFDYFVPIYSPR